MSTTFMHSLPAGTYPLSTEQHLQTRLNHQSDAVRTLEYTYQALRYRFDILPPSIDNSHSVSNQNREICAKEFGYQPDSILPHLLGWLKANLNLMWMALQSGNLDGAGYGLYLGDERLNEAQGLMGRLSAAVEVHERVDRALKLRQDVSVVLDAVDQLESAYMHLRNRFDALDGSTRDNPLVGIQARRICEVEFELALVFETPYEAMKMAFDDITGKLSRAVVDGEIYRAENLLPVARGHGVELEAYLIRLNCAIVAHTKAEDEQLRSRARDILHWLGLNDEENQVHFTRSPRSVEHTSRDPRFQLPMRRPDAPIPSPASRNPFRRPPPYSSLQHGSPHPIPTAPPPSPVLRHPRPVSASSKTSIDEGIDKTAETIDRATSTAELPLDPAVITVGTRLRKHGRGDSGYASEPSG